MPALLSCKGSRLAGWLEASVPEGQLPNAGQLRAAFVPCSSLGREELALLRRASSEEVSRLLVWVAGKDQGAPHWNQHQKSLCPVASQWLPQE